MTGSAVEANKPVSGRSAPFARLARSLRRGLLVAAGFSLALNLLMLTVPIYMTAVYDRVLASGSGATLAMLTIVALGALGLAAILETVRQRILGRLGLKLEAELGAPLVGACHSGKAAGTVQPLRDLAQLRQFATSPLAGALFDAPIAPVYFALLFLIHPHIGALALAGAAVILCVSVLNQRLTAAPSAASSEQGASALHEVQLQLRHSDAIRAMGMREACVAAWGEANAKALIAWDATERVQAIASAATRFLRLLLQVAILGYGAWLVISADALNAGIIFAASVIAARALAPVDQLVGGWRSLQTALEAGRRLRRLVQASPASGPSMALPAPSPHLGLEKVFVAGSHGRPPILKGLSFEVEPGEIVGITGPSGAGKSTLARLLVGAVQPSSGHVRLGGDELSRWDPEALGPFVGYVPQDIELFSASVARNIARMGPWHPEKVIEAARMAGCHAMIQLLEKGYDTPVGPGGHALSGGQRQRIALARAFYGRPRLLVLDEPNAALDAEGEQALIAALQAAREAGITAIVVSQRTGILPALTRLMVMQDGRIEAYGPRDEILPGQIRQASPAPAGRPGVVRSAAV